MKIKHIFILTFIIFLIGLGSFIFFNSSLYKTNKEEDNLISLGYTENEIKKLKSSIYFNDIKNLEYSKTLASALNGNYIEQYTKNYLNIDYNEIDNFIDYVNELLNKDYTNEEINLIFKKLDKDNLDDLITKEKDNEFITFLKDNYFKYNNFERYKEYKLNNPEYDINTIIMYTNIGIDNDFYTNIQTIENPDDMSVLVNKYYGLPSGWNASNLVEVSSNYSYNGQKLNVTAADALTKMMDDMRELGYTIWLVSGYRSEDYQYGLYNYYVRTQTQAVADRTSARPNHSEHQTGLAADISNIQYAIEHFANTEEYEWLQENAHKYGFIERYPKDKEFITGYDYEPWHYRYLGVDIATQIYNEKITYEEYAIKYLNQ